MARPALIYRTTCPACRRLAILAVILSAGWVRRIGVDTPEARNLATAFHKPVGQLAVFHRGRLYTGRAIPLVVMRAAIGGVARALNGRGRY
jgi:hypothetical protein